MPAMLRACTPSLTFVEGYARYAEGLAKDMNIAETPLQVARRIASCLHTLLMARIDIGINAEGWDLSTARTKYLEMHGDDPSDISRTVAWPGQAMAYPLGHRWFTAWRSQAETALGNTFNLAALRDYHEILLGDGAMEQALMQERVDAWLASRLNL